MKKNYTQPQFTFVRTDESERVFFAASGAPSAPAPKGTLGSMKVNTVSSW